MAINLTPDHVLKAIQESRERLMNVLGPTEQNLLVACERQLAAATPQEREEIGYQLLDALEKIPAAREIMQKELLRQSQDESHVLQERFIESLRTFLRNEMKNPEIQKWLGGDSQAMVEEVLASYRLRKMDSEEERVIVMEKGGIGGAKAHDFMHFHFAPNDVKELAVAAAGVMGISPEKIAVPLALVIWGTIRFLYGATTIEIDEERATVLWGVMLSRRGNTQFAEFDTILDVTNQQRKKTGLDLLTHQRMTYHLDTLVKQHILYKAPGKEGVWQLRETYQIVSDDKNVWKVLDKILK